MRQRTVTPAGLEITLLGRFAIRTTRGQEVRLVGRHAQALFTLLALTRRPRTREAIATDLWPDSMITATGPLRQALYQLRGALAAAGLDLDTMLESDAETLGMRPDAVAQPRHRSLRRCTADPDLRRRERRSRCTAATWPRASGTTASRPSASGWPTATRTRSRPSPRQRLAAGDVEGARDAAERLIARDPLREEAHEVLIAVHGLIGTRSQVVRQYRRLQRGARPRARGAPAAGDRRHLSAGPGADGRALAGARDRQGAAARSHRSSQSASRSRARSVQTRDRTGNGRSA